MSRPICIDCNMRAVQIKETNSKGVPKFRKVCSTCHGARIAKNKGISRIEHVRQMAKTTATNKGFKTASNHKEFLAKVNGPYVGNLQYLWKEGKYV